MTTKTMQLSPKKRGTMVALRYVILMIQIILLFVPCLQIKSVDEDYGLMATAGLSPIEYWTGNTVTKIKISDIGSLKEDELLTAFFSAEIDIFNPSDAPETNRQSYYVSIVISLALLLLFVVTGFKEGSNCMNTLSKTPLSEKDIKEQNDAYIRLTYKIFPRLINILAHVVTWMYVAPLSDLVISMIKYEDWSIHSATWGCLVVLVLLQDAVLPILFRKDRELIKRQNVRFNTPALPTISSDLAAIAGLFSDDNEVLTSTTAVSVVAEESEDEIYKYKRMLDDGVITQEEFQVIKQRLLGIQSNDSN